MYLDIQIKKHAHIYYIYKSYIYIYIYIYKQIIYIYIHIQRDDGLMTHSLTFSKSHLQLPAQNPRLLVHHLRHGSGHVVAEMLRVTAGARDAAVAGRASRDMM